MHSSLLAYLTAFLYLAASTIGYIQRVRRPAAQRIVSALAIAAFCLHTIILNETLNLHTVRHLSILSMLSLTTWIAILITLAATLSQPNNTLAWFIYPGAAITILLHHILPSTDIIPETTNPDIWFHLVLSVFSFSTLCIAGCLAILLAVVESMIRRKKYLNFAQALLPIETLEQILVQSITVGWLLLTVLIASSLSQYHQQLWQHPALIQKTLLALSAWVMLALLLLGRKQFGWRGRILIIGTLTGFLVQSIIYFGSRLVFGG